MQGALGRLVQFDESWPLWSNSFSLCVRDNQEQLLLYLLLLHSESRTPAIHFWHLAQWTTSTAEYDEVTPPHQPTHILHPTKKHDLITEHSGRLKRDLCGSWGRAAACPSLRLIMNVTKAAETLFIKLIYRLQCLNSFLSVFHRTVSAGYRDATE